MKNILLYIGIITVLLATACKTSKEVTPAKLAKSTSNIKSPAGFTWQNSRNLNFTVKITDTRFQNHIFMVAIYDGDPAASANLLVKGSATVLAAFKAKEYLSNQTTLVYIVKTSPDNSKTIQKVQVGTTDIVASIGI